MRPSRDVIRFAHAIASGLPLGALPALAVVQSCPPPAADCSSGRLQVIDFESSAPGTSVDGLGAVHSDLAITSQPSMAPACTVGSAAVGDACTRGATDPGNFIFVVSGAEISRVTLTLDALPGPNVGSNSLQFCRVRTPVPGSAHPWSFVKTPRRD